MRRKPPRSIVDVAASGFSWRRISGGPMTSRVRVDRKREKMSDERRRDAISGPLREPLLETTRTM
jgi:hypothetical protein